MARIAKIVVRKVRGGVEVQALSHTRRGTSYILDSTVVLDSPGGRSSRRDGVQQAAEALLNKYNVSRSFPNS